VRVGHEELTRAVLIHEWVGSLIIVISVASLAGTIFSIIQNVYFYVCPTPPPEIQDKFVCPGVLERMGWNIPGLFVGGAMLAFGFWTYRKGKNGVPLISVR